MCPGEGRPAGRPYGNFSVDHLFGPTTGNQTPFRPSPAHMHRAVIAVIRVKPEELEFGFAGAFAGIEKNGGRLEFALQIALDRSDAQVGMQGLQIGNQQDRSGRSSWAKVRSSACCSAPWISVLASDWLVFSQSVGCRASAASQIFLSGAFSRMRAMWSAIEKRCTSQPSFFSLAIQAGICRLTSKILAGAKTR